MDRQLQIVLKLQDQASAELRNVLGHLNGIQGGAERAASSFDAVSRSIIGMASSYLSFRTIYSGLSLGLQTAADLQTAQVGIKTLTGSAQDAADTIARIKIEAMRTPFTINGLAQNVQLMTTVTHSGKDALDMVLDVGKAIAAVGRGQPEMDRVITNLQEMAAVGWVNTQHLKEFGFAGIPIYDMLAKSIGTAKTNIEDLVKTHGITFDILIKAFREASASGGAFADAYTNQMGTFNQAYSNFHDSLAITAASLVTQSGLFSGLSAAMLGFSNIVQDHPRLAQGTMLLVGALAALIGVLASIGIIAPIVAAGFALIAGPIGLLIGTFVAAGILTFSFRDNLSALAVEVEAHTGIVASFRQAWEILSSAFTTQLEPALLKLWAALQPLLPYLTQMANVIGMALMLALVGAIQQLAKFVTTTAQLLAGLMQAEAWFVSAFIPSIQAVGNAIHFVTDEVNKLIAAFSKLTGIKSSALSGIGLGSIANGAAGAMGLPNFLPFANGGIVTGPTLGLVGEAGPEAIIPLSQMGRMGGVTVIVNGDVSGRELVEKVKDALMNSLGANVRMAI